MDTYGLSLAEYSDLAEKGRLMACTTIIQNPDVRARMELKYGLDFCRRRYPEAYAQPEQTVAGPVEPTCEDQK